MISFDEFERLLRTAAARVEPALEVDLLKIGEQTKAKAVSVIGHEMPTWPPLAPSTIEEKTRLGFVGHVSPTDPLLRRGDMRDSLGVAVEGLTQTVGSPMKEALWQECGTRTIPPRPWIAPAAIETVPYAERLLSETAVKLLTPGGGT